MRRFTPFKPALIIAMAASGLTNAAPTTWTFTGIVDYDYYQGPIGQLVSGWISLDLEALSPYTTNQATINGRGGIFCPSADGLGGECTGVLDEPPQVSAEYSENGFSLGFINYGSVELRRNTDQGFNSFEVRAASPELNKWIVLNVSDFLAADSNIFYSSSGDLSLTQQINWSAMGALPQFSVISGRCCSPDYYKSGTILTMAVSTVPEPSSFVLAISALGLLGIAQAVRHKLARI